MAKKIKKTYKELAIAFKKTKNIKVYNELYSELTNKPALVLYKSDKQYYLHMILVLVSS